MVKMVNFMLCVFSLKHNKKIEPLQTNPSDSILMDGKCSVFVVLGLELEFSSFLICEMEPVSL